MNPPKRVQYRGSAYTLRTAAEPKLTPEEEEKRRQRRPTRKERRPKTDEDSPGALPPPKEEDEGYERLSPEDLEVTAPEAPPDVELGERPVEDISDVEEITGPLQQALLAESNKYLEEMGIKASVSKQEVKWSTEEDGLDLVFELKTDNFSAVPDSSITFDYGIEMELPEGMGITEEGVATPKAAPTEARVKKDAGFFSDLVKVTQAGEVVGSKKLQEVVFRFCSRNFVAPAREAGPLLQAVKVFQDSNITKVEAGPLAPEYIFSLLEAEEGEEKDSKIHDYVTELIKDIKENRLDKKYYGDQWRSDYWDNPNLVSKLIDKLSGVGKDSVVVIKGPAASILQDFVAKHDKSSWKLFHQQTMSESPPGRIALLQEEVEKATRALTSHEGYKGSIDIGADEKNAVASIRAPYQTIYLFDKKPGSPKPIFKEMRVRLCNHTWVAKNQDAAERLLSAQLDLADAAKRTVDPALSVDKAAPTSPEVILQRVLDEVEKEKGQEDKPPEASPATEGKESPPSPEEVKAAQYRVVPEYPY